MDSFNMTSLCTVNDLANFETGLGIKDLASLDIQCKPKSSIEAPVKLRLYEPFRNAIAS
jgi:hypothetical protein